MTIDNQVLAQTIAARLRATTGLRFETLDVPLRKGRTINVSWRAPDGASEDTTATDIIQLLPPFSRGVHSVRSEGDGQNGTLFVTEVR